MTPDDVIEVYSPPRVVQAAAARGLKAEISIDLQTGYDLSFNKEKITIRALLQRRRPRLLITSPPCTKFSPMQNLRPHPERLEDELPAAIEHVNYSMDLQQDQVSRGGHSLHEHPDTATSWTLPKVQQFLARDEVLLVKSDQRRFGLRAREGLNRKSTLFAVTCDQIAVELQRLCAGDHPHEPLIGGLPARAQEYPPELVKAIIDGLIQEWRDQQTGQPRHLPDRGDLEQWCDELDQKKFQWREFHGMAGLVLQRPQSIPSHGPGHRHLRWTWCKNPYDGKWLQLERAKSGKAKPFEVTFPYVVILYQHQAMVQQTFAAEDAPKRSISANEKMMVLRAHVNLGHPRVREFVRLLKAAGTRNDIVDYVLKEFTCAGCAKEQRMPTRLPSATPRTYDFNIVIGIDLLFVHGASPLEEHPVLNVTCIGTLYSTFTMVDAHRRSSALVWATFLQAWLRVFGSPSFLILDQGLESAGHFVEGLENLAWEGLDAD